jgi:hypothetical protein
MACGDVLGPGGRFQLEQDVECFNFNSAFTVRDGAILNLNGHTVKCGQITTGCIVLRGTGAQLLNGTVQGGFHHSIILEGTGGHTVRNVTSTFVDANILVLSDNNRLIDVTAESVFNPAFNILGNNNRLTNNSAFCLVLFFSNIGCIRVTGDENRLVDNFATSTVDGPFTMASGFLITGNNNWLRRNQAINNEQRGIVVTGVGNDLRFNVALENALDLQDTNDNCVYNVWKHNIFETRSPACIQ